MIEFSTRKIFYLDFYSIERFGKTKLGWMLLYAKQSQNKILIKEICESIQKKINELLVKYNINAVSFVPPTVKREIQLMAEIENNLNILEFSNANSRLILENLMMDL